MGKPSGYANVNVEIPEWLLANAEAETLRIAAETEAEANREIAASLTPELIEKIKYEKWSGNLPQVTGGTPIISLD